MSEPVSDGTQRHGRSHGVRRERERNHYSAHAVVPGCSHATRLGRQAKDTFPGIGLIVAAERPATNDVMRTEVATLRYGPKHRRSRAWHLISSHRSWRSTMITCIIRYHIDPTKKAEFEQYARNWGQAIPRCGANLVGYFAPHEGSTTLAYGIYSVASLA